MENQVTLISMDRVQESPLNPRRRTFDPEKLSELAASLESHGMLQAVLVRPGDNGSYELVCGARRLRAAGLAGLTEIPATIRELTDKEVLEVQVIENLQRQDLHPLEEAEGYQRLHKSHGYSAEELAAKVGKSRAYVYARMKLCALPPKAKKLFWEDKLDASRALLVARIPNPKLADQAAAEIAKPRFGGAPLSYRDAQRHIHDHFMMQLAGAPFDTKDLDLVKRAGSCTDCAKRTGNLPDLFGDCRTDVCTDPNCFKTKADAAWRVFKERVTAEGHTVKEGRAAREMYHGHVGLDDHCYEHPKQPRWRELFKDQDVKLIWARDEAHEKPKAFVSRKEANALLRKLKITGRGRGGSSPREAVEQKRHQLRTRTIKATIGELVERAEAFTDGEALARFVADQLLRGHSDPIKQASKRREIDFGPAYGSSATRDKALAAMTPPQLRGLIVELVALDFASSTYGDGYGEGWTTACKMLGIDLKVREKGVSTERTKRARAVKKPRTRKKAAPRRARKVA